MWSVWLPIDHLYLASFCLIDSGLPDRDQVIVGGGLQHVQLTQYSDTRVYNLRTAMSAKSKRGSTSMQRRQTYAIMLSKQSIRIPVKFSLYELSLVARPPVYCNSGQMGADPFYIWTWNRNGTSGVLLLFLPRDASAERGDATVSRLSVCPSVCP